MLLSRLGTSAVGREYSGRAIQIGDSSPVTQSADHGLREAGDSQGRKEEFQSLVIQVSERLGKPIVRHRSKRWSGRANLDFGPVVVQPEATY